MTAFELLEAFHLAFLHRLARSVALGAWCLKDGSNLRFFFGSVCYSEDMDIDIEGVPVFELRDKVMAILRSPGLAGALRPVGVAEIRLPNLAVAKQTETVQRFKVRIS